MMAGFKKEVQLEHEGRNIVSLVVGSPVDSSVDFELFDNKFINFNLYCEYSLGPVVDRRKVKCCRGDQEDLKDVFSEVLKNRICYTARASL